MNKLISLQAIRQQTDEDMTEIYRRIQTIGNARYIGTDSRFNSCLYRITYGHKWVPLWAHRQNPEKLFS